MDMPTALKKLSNAWKLYKRETQPDGTVKVVENGVQVTVKHEDWAGILKAMHKYGGE